MPKVFIGSIKKSSKTNELVEIIYQIPQIKSVKVVYPRAFRMTKGFAIFELEFKGGLTLERFKRLKIKFKGEFLYLADYLEGDQIRNRDSQLARKKVYVSKIPRATSKNDLKLLFSQFGPVETAYICREKAQKCFLYGFVTFFKEVDADRCTVLRKVPFNGRMLRVKKFTPKGDTRKIQGRRQEDSPSSEELYVRRRDYQALEGERAEANEPLARGQGANRPLAGDREANEPRAVNRETNYERPNTVQAQIKRYIPSINFEITDERIHEIVEVSSRNPWEISNLRFNISELEKQGAKLADKYAGRPGIATKETSSQRRNIDVAQGYGYPHLDLELSASRANHYSGNEHHLGNYFEFNDARFPQDF